MSDSQESCVTSN